MSMSEDEALSEIGLLYNHKANDERQFTRWQMVCAMRHGHRLGSGIQVGKLFRSATLKADEAESRIRRVFAILRRA